MKTCSFFFPALALCFILFFPGLILAQTANLQLIHNALGVDAAEGPPVDIYLNGQTAPELQGISFRSATAYLEVDAATAVIAGVALSPSTGPGDTLVAFHLGAFAAGSNNVAVIYGTAGDDPSSLRVASREAAAVLPGEVNLLTFHGSPSTAAIDIADFFGEFNVTGIKYGDFGNDQAIAPRDYFLEVYPSGTGALLGTFQFDFAGRGGQSLLLFSSGLGDADPLLNLFVASPDGQVEPFLPVALVQIIHNSPAPALAHTDVWVNDLNVLLLENFAYLEATPVAFFPTRLVFDLGFAPPGSAGPGEAVFVIENVSFNDGRQHTVFVGGIPDDADFPLQLFINDEAKLTAPGPEEVSVNVFHGIPGAEAIDVDLREGPSLALDLTYGQFSAYAELAPGPAVWVLRDAVAARPLASFAGDLTPAAGQAATLFAGGFPGGGEPPGLYAVLADGRVLALDPVTRVQLIHNAPAEAYDVYLNGQRIVNDMVFRSATPYLDLPTREPQQIALVPWAAPPGSAPLVTFDPLTLEDGREYLLMVAGVAGSPDQPIGLQVFDEARLTVADEQESALLFFHGSPDAPALDLLRSDRSAIFADVARGTFDGYAALPASIQNLLVTAAGDEQDVLGAYALDLSALGGKTAVLYATGYLEAGQIAPFEVWMAQADGTTRPLAGPTSVRRLRKLEEGLTLWPNPTPGGANLEFHLKEGAELDLQLLDGQGRRVRSYQLGRLAAGDHRFQLDTGGLPAGVFLVVVRAGEEVLSAKLLVL